MENKISTIKERVVLLIEHKKIAKETFFKKVGITSANFRGKAKDTPLNSTAIANIFVEFPDISLEWLVTGEGKMYRNTENTVTRKEKNSPSKFDKNSVKDRLFIEENDDYRLVPLINMDIIGSNDMYAHRHILKKVPFLSACETDVCFMITNTGIQPVYPFGSIALVREVENWQDFFGYGNVYCILLKDGRKILKEVQKYDENPKEYVLCVSHNNNYPAEELPKDMIHRVWKIVQVLLPENW